jgi:hypothetical protein
MSLTPKGKLMEYMEYKKRLKKEREEREKREREERVFYWKHRRPGFNQIANNLFEKKFLNR